MARQESKRTFTKGRLERDLDERLVPDGTLRDALNVSVGESEGSDVGAIENLPGTTLLNTGDGMGRKFVNSEVIGSVSDPENNKIYWFNAGIAPIHASSIQEHDTVTGVNKTVLIDGRNPNVLNFRTEFPIISANVVDGFLYWTDNFNEPRKIDIVNFRDIGIHQVPGSTTSIYGRSFLNRDITVIRPHPSQPATIASSTSEIGVIDIGTGDGTPTVTTRPANNITQTAATLNAVSSTPASEITIRGFYFGTQNTESGLVNEGTRVLSPLVGSSFSALATGLTAGTTYNFFAFAINDEGQTNGNIVSFQSASLSSMTISVPIVRTDVATATTPTTTTLEGFVSDDGNEAPSDRGFRYQINGTAPATAQQLPIVRTSGQNTFGFDLRLTGLSTGDVVYYAAYATNSSDTGFGNIRSVTTSLATVPAVITHPASSVTSSEAILNGEVTSNGGLDLRDRGFLWSRITTSRQGFIDNQGDLNANINDVEVSGIAADYNATITGLTSGVTYYFIAYARNDQGMVYGEVRNFTTTTQVIQAAPTVITSGLTATSSTSVQSTGNVTSENGSEVIRRGFYFGTQSSQAGLLANTPVIEPGRTGTMLADHTGLTTGTRYYTMAFAQNSIGTNYGAIFNVTPQTTVNPGGGTDQLPTVLTQTESSVGQNTFTMNGSIVSAGSEPLTGIGFYWGGSGLVTADNLRTAGTKVALTPATVGQKSSTISSGILPGETYHYVIYAETSLAPNGVLGQVEPVLTEAATRTRPTVSTLQVQTLTSNSAVLRGNVTTDGGAPLSRIGFRYSSDINDLSPQQIYNNGTNVVATPTEVGPFSKNVTGLTAGTTYRFVAYAENSQTTSSTPSLGGTLPFNTPSGVSLSAPEVSTEGSTNILETSARISGRVGSTGGDSLTSIGFYIGTVAPTSGQTGESYASTSGVVRVETNSNPGDITTDYSTSRTGLSPGTNHYYVAYAQNSTGTGYGSIEQFTTTSQASSLSIESTLTAVTFNSNGSAQGSSTATITALPSGSSWTFSVGSWSVGGGSPLVQRVGNNLVFSNPGSASTTRTSQVTVTHDGNSSVSTVISVTQLQPFGAF